MISIIIGLLLSVFLSLPSVQTKLAQEVTSRLNAELGTDIRINRLKIVPLTLKTHLKGIYIEDHQGDTLVYMKKLSTSIINMKQLIDGDMKFGDIEVDELFLNMVTYEGEKDTNLDVFIDLVDDGQPRAEGTAPFLLTSSEIFIGNSRYKLIDYNDDEPEILDFTELNVKASDFQILGPEVDIFIEDMAFESGRGISVEKMSTQFRYTKSQMVYNGLYIRTPESELKGRLQFNYKREELKDFLDKVQLEAEFADSYLSLNEVNRFYKAFGENKMARLECQVKGTLNDFLVSDLALQTTSTRIRGEYRFQNLFKKEEPFKLFADIDQISTSYFEIRALMPTLVGRHLPSSFEKFGPFTLRGDAEITDSSIDIEANLETAIGRSYANLQMTNINAIDQASYLGLVSLMDFDLGSFIGNPKLGKASLDVNVEGKGFTAEFLETEAIGEVYSIDFNGYNYNNIQVSGVFKEELFDGMLKSDDPNISFDFKGLADMKADMNRFNFTASVKNADLRKLNFLKDSIALFKGDITLDATGNTLDNIQGSVQFTNTIYENQNDQYVFEDFAVVSEFSADSLRNIQIASPDIMNGYMRGRYKLDELQALFQNSIGSIYTNYRPYEVSEGQFMNFNFKLRKKIVEVFFPEINFDPNTYLRGQIVADEGDFKMTFRSPGIELFQNSFEDIEVRIDNKNPVYNTYVAVKEMSTVYYDVKDFELINTTLSDTLFFRTEFKGGKGYDDTYNLNFYHTFNEEQKSVIGLKRSDLSFKGNTWLINKDSNPKNKIIINNSLDSIYINDIVMDNGNQEQIRLSGSLADSTYKDLDLDFKIVSLAKITPSIDSLALDGRINGYLNIRQREGNYLPTAGLDIENFTVNDSVMGNLLINVSGNTDLTEYAVNCELSKGLRERFSVLGKIYNRNSAPRLDLIAGFSDFPLEPFAPLGEDVLTNIRGKVNGTVNLQGLAENPDMDGSLTLTQAGFDIPYLNVNYDFSPFSKVDLEGQSFWFRNLDINDNKEGTTALLNGNITHLNFEDWTLDLNLATRGDRFLILDTEFDEEALYYGTGFVNGTGSITGPTNALNITFDGSTAPGTSLKIPLSDLTSVGDYSFINFIEKDVALGDGEKRVLDDYEGLELTFDLLVTPDAEVEIVMDQQTGSSLKGTGEGLLLMDINTNGKFNMYGDFATVTGEYNFKYGGIIDKKFIVRPGGYITWDGDPLQATLNMEAVYALNANPAPLLDNGQGYTGRIPTEVVVRLDGELENTNIGFDIQFPNTSSVVQSELEYRLQDPNVEERNAFFLLAQGTFVNDQIGLTQQALTGNLIQTASGLINQVLSVGDEKLDIGFLYEQGLDVGAGGAGNTENRIGVTVSTQISDRILVNGRVGLPVGGGGVSESVVAGDVEVQVLLNEEGTLRARIFNRENEIQQFLAERQGYTQGIGLSYQVDFNTFQDLLRKVFKKKSTGTKPKEESEQTPFFLDNDSLIEFKSKTASDDGSKRQN